jgi:hypothetical protein
MLKNDWRHLGYHNLGSRVVRKSATASDGYTSDAAKHPTTYKTALHNKEFSGMKC